MILSKELLQLCAQECINTYKGEYGKVIPLLEDRREHDIGKVEWVTGLYDKDFYIIFRGSDGKADWADNIEYKQVPYTFDHTLQLHKGFYKDQYLLVRQQLLNEVFEYFKLRPKGRVIVSGHSLGGALAIICAYDIKQTCNMFEITCASFAAPRVGNAKFTKAYKNAAINTYLFRYKNDTVTQVPFTHIPYMKKTCITIFGKYIYKPIILRYSRVDSLIKLGKYKWYEYLPNFILKKVTNPMDHYPEKYLKGLEYCNIGLINLDKVKSGIS